MIRLILRNIRAYILGILLAIFLFLPIFLLVVIIPARWRYTNPAIFWLLDKAYRIAVWGLFVPVTVRGAENIPDKPAIIAGNHQSSIDIILVGSLLKAHPHTWYVLSEYYSTPFLGMFVRRMGVFLDRTNPARAAHGLVKGIKIIEEHKCHMVIFPEGGRHADLAVHEFFQGFAIIARRTGRPVVPVYMPYNYKVLPPGGLIFYEHPLFVIVGPPLFFNSDDTDATFTERVRAWFLAQQP